MGDERSRQNKDEAVEEAVMRVLKGDSHAFVSIVEAYQQPIFMYCWRILNQRQDAEDAVQDIMVKAFKKLETYRPDTAFSSWLYKIAYHHCLNIMRRRRLLCGILPLLRTDGEHADSAEETLTKRIFSEPMDIALRKLKPEERNLLILRVFEEKSFTEIGLIMDKSADSIKKRYQRLLGKIKKGIVEREGEQEWDIIRLMWKKS